MTYSYDRQGNMLSDGRNQYAYDDFGRLASTVTAEGDIQKNCYDAEGLRAEMEENGRLVQFLYNEDREVVAEKDYSGNLIRYIRGLGLISSDSENAKTYYHYVFDEQGREQDRILNQYEYDAFGNTISCKEQVENRFRYQGEQYDPITRQYYLRARYYNPVIGRFIQEDTYYGDGLNLYTYCRNNPILNHDPTGHGTKENSPYSRKEQQYIDVGADPDTARLAVECYPDANSKKSLYDKYKKQGYNAQDAKKLANYEIVHGEERAKNYAANNVKKSGPDYTATSPRENPNTDWRTQNRFNAQKKAGAGKSGSKAIGTDELVVRDTKFLDADGNIDWEKWAPNGERVPGTIKENQTIPAGTIIDRYGSQWGKYTSPAGVPYEQRALPYIENPNAYHKYEVLKPIDNVTISEIAPAFEQVGGGIQYELPNNIKKLKELDYIKEIR